MLVAYGFASLQLAQPNAEEDVSLAVSARLDLKVAGHALGVGGIGEIGELVHDRPHASSIPGAQA